MADGQLVRRVEEQIRDMQGAEKDELIKSTTKRPDGSQPQTIEGVESIPPIPMEVNEMAEKLGTTGFDLEVEQYGENIRSLPHYKFSLAATRFLSDHFERLSKLERETYGEPGKPIVKRLAEVVEKPVEWFWKGRIPRGKLTVIDGDPGSGKSWLTSYLAARVTVGDPLPGEEDANRHPERVLLLSEDDEADTIKPRIRVMGGDETKIDLLRGVLEREGKISRVSLANIAPLRRTIEVWRPGLVIVDPTIRYLGQMDTNKATAVRSILDPLSDVAKEFGCAIVCVRHLNKDAVLKALYRGQGSMDFIGAARSAFIVVEYPDNPKVRVICHTKSNNAPLAPSFTFRIEQSKDEIGRFILGDTITLTADELANAPQGKRSLSEGEDKLELAKGFLLGMLIRGQTPQAVIMDCAGRMDIKERTLERAKAALKIASHRLGNQWVWELPANIATHPGAVGGVVDSTEGCHAEQVGGGVDAVEGRHGE